MLPIIPRSPTTYAIGIPPGCSRSGGLDNSSPSFGHEDSFDKVEDGFALTENDNFVVYLDSLSDDLEEDYHLRKQGEYAQIGMMSEREQ